MKNCLSFALGIEGLTTNPGNLNWFLSVPKALEEKCTEFNLSIRSLENSNSNLLQGEWKIVFFGFVPIRRDYEGRIELCDYHLVRKINDNWFHRKTWNSEPTIAPIDLLISEYQKAGYEISYFAIKKTED